MKRFASTTVCRTVLPKIVLTILIFYRLTKDHNGKGKALNILFLRNLFHEI